MGLDDANSQDKSGLDSNGLDESGLSNQGDDSSDDLEPLDFTHQVPPPLNQNEENNQQGSGLEDGMAGLSDNNGTAGTEAPGQEIQTQSPSLSSLAPGSDGAENLDLNAPSGLDSPPLVAFNTPEDSASGTSSGHGVGDAASTGFPLDALGSTGEEGTGLPVEQIPGNIAVAKAEPSDAIREQLDKIKEEEAATLAAGLNDIFFEFDSWTLTAEGRQALDHGAEWLNSKAAAKLLIEGHCDSRGTQAYNLVLGKKRAAAIRDYLVELGITPERLAIISYGQDKPFCTDPTEVCYQLNRRGHLLVQKQQID